MTSAKRIDYVARDSILKLLSETELARVSTAETAVRLTDGDEYIDLEAFENGVRKAPTKDTPTSRMLPRSSVQPATWAKILDVVAML